MTQVLKAYRMITNIIKTDVVPGPLLHLDTTMHPSHWDGWRVIEIQSFSVQAIQKYIDDLETYWRFLPDVPAARIYWGKPEKMPSDKWKAEINIFTLKERWDTELTISAYDPRAKKPIPPYYASKKR